MVTKLALNKYPIFISLPFLMVVSMGNSSIRSNSLPLNHNSLQKIKHTHKSSLKSNLFPLFLPVVPKTYNWISAQEQDRNALLKAYENSLKNPKKVFSFPKGKYYKMNPHRYRVYEFTSNCFFISRKYRNVCESTSDSYDDQLITYKPKIMINSLKGFDPLDYHIVKQKLNNLEYDDWNLTSILKNDKSKVNWKQNYGYFKKNVFYNSVLSFNNRLLKPFTSQKYSIHVERDAPLGSNIPMFTGFHKARNDLNGILGFEAYDEVNLDLDTFLSRNNLDSPPPDYLQNHKGIQLHTHTKDNYGWHNNNWSPLYKSYAHAQEIVERMNTGIVDNFGSPFVSWQLSQYWNDAKRQHDHIVDLYTPVPLSDRYDTYELKPMDTDHNNSNITEWDNDLFHVNYDKVIRFDPPYYSNENLIYPFSLDLFYIRLHTRDLESFFKISENFNFYINYTYNNEDKRSPAYRIQDLIKPNSIMIRKNNYNNTNINNISDIFLSIEPIDHDRVELINPGYSQWEFSVTAQNSNHYKLVKNRTSIDSININDINNISVNEKVLNNMLPSQLNHYQYLKQVFNTDKNKPLSENQILTHLKPITDYDDLSGRLRLSYFDPVQKKTITKVFTDMIRLDHDDKWSPTVNNSRVIKHSSFSSLFDNNKSLPNYLLSNKYWNDHTKIIPIQTDSNGFPIRYKLDLRNLRVHPKTNNQWKSIYSDQVFSDYSNFSVAPIQKQRYTLNEPDHYINSPSFIWDELIVNSPLAKAVDIDQTDFSLSTQKEGDNSFIVNVSYKDQSRVYTFTYDKTKIVDGMIDDANNPYAYHPPVKTDWSTFFSNLYSYSSISDTTKILLSILLSSLLAFCIGYFGLKIIRQRKYSSLSV